MDVCAGFEMSEPQEAAARTLLTMTTAEMSRTQFRALFQQHEPELFLFSDSMLNVFGRSSIAAVRVLCYLKT